MESEMDASCSRDVEMTEENRGNVVPRIKKKKLIQKDIHKKDVKYEVYTPELPLGPEEELRFDKSAYIMLHSAQTGNPCLSFDIIRDNLGEKREEFPLTAYVVGGTQAAKARSNSVLVVKMVNLTKIKKKNSDDSENDDSNDSEDSDDSDLAEEEIPQMHCALIKHAGCVNRIRASVHQGAPLVATWSELGRVNVWNISLQLAAVDSPLLMSRYKEEQHSTSTTPLFTFSGHQVEGFALDWSSVMPGVLATGDCKRDIHVWNPSEGGTWLVDQRPLIGHVASVEDVQWSPNERNVLASCSVDKRFHSNAHDSDVNVISWNRNEPFIASGGDDGVVHIWDLRQFQSESPVATFKHHIEPVTTVEWHPTEATVFASGGADNQVALWDLSVERDMEPEQDLKATLNISVQDLPQELLFIHQGQTDIKELHWHPQLPGVIFSTAQNGFNVFRTISV
uniref:Histone-binding protein RBBP4-like N-terminal domain-containing protein n=1 Tax=Timema cristinae TaxID=61476 RepID=A0A7R9H5T8_TIMCR|nr:unnamed protein product [Timema cristinae]